jgi:hypothetical protein
MPDISRIITLTSKGNSAGPSFRAQYSNDCVTYINTIGTSLINLPSIGSTATVTYPDTAICLRLVNQNASCEENNVVQIIGTTTTSTTSTSTTSTTTLPPTTTTTSTSTTTSTTTLPPTTTTTTTLAACYQGVVVQVTNGDALNWETCYGISDGGFYPVGEHTLPGCIKPLTIVGDGETTFTITSFGTPCTTTTSTSTTSTTSTTTLPPTTTTTTTLAPCYQNTTVQVTNGDALNWLTCAGISDGGFYPVGEHTLPGCIQPETIVGDGETTFTITTYGTPCTTTTSTSTTSTTTAATVYYVLERCSDANTFYSIGYPSGTFADRQRVTAEAGGITYTFIIVNVLTFNPGGGLLTLTGTAFSECPATTTTIPPACVINTTINVTDTGWIRWTNCYGDNVDTFLSSLGTYTITECIQFNTIRSAFPLADLADWNNVVWGSACTTTTSTSTTSTTSTTTAATATLAWSYTETGGADGVMDLYINGTIEETRINTSNGTYTVNVGDTIAMELSCGQCTGGGDTYANVYTSGIISDAACGNNTGASIFTSNYTVVSGDIGTTLTFNAFASCESACL